MELVFFLITKIIKKDIKKTRIKVKLVQKKQQEQEKRPKKPVHLLSDLIQFDDVEDDDLWFEEDAQVVSRPEAVAKKAPKSRASLAADYDEITAEDFATIEEDSSQSSNIIDSDTKTEAFRHIIAGACMSMGLKFAGTFNQEAYETLVSCEPMRLRKLFVLLETPPDAYVKIVK